MNSEIDPMNMGNLCRGAALEMFEKLLPEILDNIRNPNTKVNVKRKLSLEFTFVPNAERNYAEVTITPTIKTAGVKPAEGSIFIAQVGGTTTAFTHDPRQDELTFSKPESAAKQ